MAPAMAGQGTRGVHIGNTDAERNAGLPIFASFGSTECGPKLCKDLPSPGGRRPEARFSCASPLKVSPILPAGLAPENRASGRRRGASLFADTP